MVFSQIRLVKCDELVDKRAEARLRKQAARPGYALTTRCISLSARR